MNITARLIFERELSLDEMRHIQESGENMFGVREKSYVELIKVKDSNSKYDLIVKLK